MILDTVRDAFSLIRTYPAIIFPGFIIAILSFLELILTYFVDPFYGEFLRIFQIFLLPFLIAGVYGVIKVKSGAMPAFFREGVRYYFRILIPTILVLFAVLITSILVLVPIAALGMAADMGTVLTVLLGVSLSISIFTSFYDCAAVFEDRKAFDSILRSVSLVLSRFIHCLLFYLLLLVLIILIFLGATTIMSVLLAGQLEPLLQMTPAELEMLSTSDMLALLSEEGMIVLSAVSIIGLGIFMALLYPLKAAFFLRLTEGPGEAATAPLQGEYDEKGRYYKY